MAKRSWIFVVIAAFVWSGSAFAGKKTGIRGRYLEVEPGITLSPYKGAVVVLEPAEITSDKDKPVDTQAVRTSSEELLHSKLQSLGVFKEVVSAVPADLPAETPVIRMTTKLTLQHGSQAMRFFVGSGAGKSKLHIRLDMVDVKSGQHLAFFNGYGTGAGLWSISGGGVQRMAKDDFEENYAELARLLGQHLR